MTPVTPRAEREGNKPFPFRILLPLGPEEWFFCCYFSGDKEKEIDLTPMRQTILFWEWTLYVFWSFTVWHKCSFVVVSYSYCSWECISAVTPGSSAALLVIDWLKETQLVLKQWSVYYGGRRPSSIRSYSSHKRKRLLHDCKVAVHTGRFPRESFREGFVAEFEKSNRLMDNFKKNEGEVLLKKKLCNLWSISI